MVKLYFEYLFSKQRQWLEKIEIVSHKCFPTALMASLNVKQTEGHIFEADKSHNNTRTSMENRFKIPTCDDK